MSTAKKRNAEVKNRLLTRNACNAKGKKSMGQKRLIHVVTAAEDVKPGLARVGHECACDGLSLLLVMRCRRVRGVLLI